MYIYILYTCFFLCFVYFYSFNYSSNSKRIRKVRKFWPIQQLEPNRDSDSVSVHVHHFHHPYQHLAVVQWHRSHRWKRCKETSPDGNCKKKHGARFLVQIQGRTTQPSHQIWYQMTRKWKQNTSWFLESIWYMILGWVTSFFDPSISNIYI